MLDHGRLHLGGGHPLPSDLEHVVGPAAVPVVAVGVPVVLIAAHEPLAAKGLPGPLVLVPVPGRDAVPSDEQIPDLSRGHIPSGLIDDADRVARNRLAAAPRPDPARPVADVDVQRLGRSDPVEDLHAEPLLPSGQQRARQGLPRGDAQPDAPEAGRPFLRQHRRVGGGHPKEQGRPVPADQIEVHSGLEPPRGQHGGGAHPERKVQGVAQPVGEEELGDRQADVVVADPQHGPRVQFGGAHHVVVEVDGALGRARAAAAPQPKRRLVPVGRRRIEVRVGGGQEVAQRVPPRSRRPGPRHDHVAEGALTGERGLDGGEEFFAHGEHRRPAVAQHVGVVVGLERRVRRDRHRPDPDRPPEQVRELRGVQHQQQDPLFRAHAEVAQGVPRAVDLAQEGPVGDPIVAGINGDAVAPPLVQVSVQKRGGNVELLRKLEGCGHRAPRFRRPRGHSPPEPMGRRGRGRRC